MAEYKNWLEVVIKEYYRKKDKINFTTNMWDDFFPSWVPNEMKEQIISANEFHNRLPQDYIINNDKKNSPKIGEIVTLYTISGKKKATGIFFHFLNNIGRVVSFGEYTVVSF